MRLRRPAVLAAVAAVVALAVAGCTPKTTQAVPAELQAPAPAVSASVTPPPTPSASVTPEAQPDATPTPIKVNFTATPKPTPSAEVTMDAKANADAAAKQAAVDKEKAQESGQVDASTTDPRCGYGEVLCISKSTNKLHFMQDGTVVSTLDVRFGQESDPDRRTREGNFLVFRKEVEHTSNLYGSEMPYAMFFSGGQAVHYSSDFAARGYNGSSHGCVNVRDKAALAQIFAEVDVMSTRVVVY